jgi:membrane peptidoglycan carboxypeptidase
MNTSLARRQRHRRNGNGKRVGGGSARTVAIVFPLFLFSTFLLMGVVGFAAAVSAYSFYSQGLPDPKTKFGELGFDEQTVVFDRTTKVELARFGQTQRQVIDKFEQLGPILVDATTSIEDKTFWDNAGFDPLGIVSAAVDTARGQERGASTITQQLVRARLLPDSAFTGTKYERKVKEIIQSIRLTQEFSGLEGKQKILVAYLNQNYYGDQSYGVAAAAHDYFGVTDLRKLTVAQAAILAAIPQSPTAFDLRKNAEEQTSPDGKRTMLVVPADSPIVMRRNLVLDRMLINRVLTRPGTDAPITDEQILAAKNEPVIVAPDSNSDWRAPHFVWQVRHQLGTILCPDTPDNCEKIDSGGYQVTTTLDWRMQQMAERWVKGAAIAPNHANRTAYLKANKIPNQAWISDLVGRGVYNAALAAMDYRTGEVHAYVGSGGYYEKARGKKFQPQFDALSDGWRQPGSAFKPVNYITGLNDKTTTAATMYMDVVTDFGGGYTPTDADLAERGPVRMRQALQLSLNIPAIKNAAMVGPDRVYAQAQKMGIEWQSKTNPGGVTIGIGTLELHYADLLSAYGAIANNGLLMPRTYIQVVRDANGKQIWSEKDAPGAKGKQVVSPQAAYIMTDIIASNTEPAANPFWSRRAIYDGNVRRPATLKTGTTNNEIDLAAFGYLAPPKDPKAPALVVGAWMGNSDNSIPPRGTVALETAASMWQAFLTQASHGMPIADFKRPAGVVDATVDAFTGLKPGPFSKKTVKEQFIQGTTPTEVDYTKVPKAIDKATNKLWAEGCTGPKVTRGFLDFSRVDAAFPRWQRYDRGWAARAAKGSGVSGGPEGTRTAYFGFGSRLPFGASWGAPFPPKATCTPLPSPSPSPSSDCHPVFGCPSPSGLPEPTPTPKSNPRRVLLTGRPRPRRRPMTRAHRSRTPLLS